VYTIKRRWKETEVISPRLRKVKRYVEAEKFVPKLGSMSCTLVTKTYLTLVESFTRRSWGPISWWTKIGEEHYGIA